MTPVLHFISDFFVGGVCVKHSGMVKGMNNLIDNGLEVSKIYYHSIFDIFSIINGMANDRDIEFVTVSVDIFTKAVIV